MATCNLHVMIVITSVTSPFISVKFLGYCFIYLSNGHYERVNYNFCFTVVNLLLHKNFICISSLVNFV